MRAVRAIALGIGAAGVALVMSLSATAAATIAGSAGQAGTGQGGRGGIYKTKCQVCHSADGNSPMPEMSFADGEWNTAARSRK